MRKFVLPLLAGVAGLLVSAESFAAAATVTDVVTEVTAQNAPLAAVGIAITVMFVGVKAFKMVRKALN